MQNQTRIPKLREVSFDGALTWFSELQCESLLFHPEDDPAEIIRISDGTTLFSESEVIELKFLLEELESGIGHEQVIEAAYPVFMTTFGNRLDA